MGGSVRQRWRPLVVTSALAALAALAATSTGAISTVGQPSAAAAPAASAFMPVGPLRLADTRLLACGCSRLDASTIVVDVAGRPGIPSEIVAAAVTITATPTASAGYVTAYPAGTNLPNTSTVNTRPDRVVANSTIVPVGDDGSIAVFHLVPGDLIIDVTGVFVPTATASAGRFVPVSTRRLIDTRVAEGGAGPLGAAGELTLLLPPEVDGDATALVVNVTSVDDPSPGNLSTRPAGEPPRTTSFLNTNGSGQAIAASVIVPVSPAGFTIGSHSGGHVIVDLTGWFTGPSAAESSAGLFHALPPTRVLDTRAQPPRLFAGGTIELANPIAGAAALVTNVTVTQTDRRGYVAAFPAGTARPPTSAVNPVEFDHTVANMAITRVSERGVAYWSLTGVDLVIDITGSFAGTPVAATVPPAPNTPTRSRVLLVGDSTLAGLNVYTSAQSALRGFDATVDAESCRRLVRPSCRSSDTGRIPNTVVQAILGTPGTLNIVVVKSGYNDWFSDFPTEFDAVVAAARAKGAHTIIWFTQNEDVSRPTARRAYEENNADLRWLTRLPQYADVVLADWLAYSAPRPDWFHDGTHVTRAGAYAITDYVARWIAALEHRPCPRPWVVGGSIPHPCPPPDRIGPVPDPIAVSG